MRDRGLIYSGLAIFLALVTFPAWHNLSAGVTAKGPNVRLPASEKQCVAPAEYMRTSHMTLLMNWRDEVVRAGGRDYTAPDGKRYVMSLTPTCLEQCHGTKAEFCDRCHNYAAVSPACWNCHLDSRPVLRSAR
ncbi:MAG TPA: sulfate reduction electron transfer complex DsrMKJOP subunit DsrJ [Bryobacteraceae bacterium]|nr:sulfate reduction electron transfer complex DsrMKJOP subunit DsrJ [Bryobacteraceae bacterium]